MVAAAPARAGGLGGRVAPQRSVMKLAPELWEMSRGAPAFRADPQSERADGHAVVPGENLSSIAGRYGVSVDALAAANNIDDPNLVVAGTVLTIPGTTAAPQSVYVVEAGDSLTAVAAMFGDSLGDLMTQNQIGDPNLIYIGQRLIV